MSFIWNFPRIKFGAFSKYNNLSCVRIVFIKSTAAALVLSLNIYIKWQTLCVSAKHSKWKGFSCLFIWILLYLCGEAAEAALPLPVTIWIIMLGLFCNMFRLFSFVYNNEYASLTHVPKKIRAIFHNLIVQSCTNTNTGTRAQALDYCSKLRTNFSLSCSIHEVD